MKLVNRWSRSKRCVPRIDVDALASSGCLNTVEPSYSFTYGSETEFRGDGATTRVPSETGFSFGGRYLDLKAAIVEPGWDLIEHSKGVTWPQLTSSSEILLENYSKEGRLIEFDSKSFTLRKERLPSIQIPRAISLFGAYMTQWGHVMSDLIHRLWSVESLLADFPVLIDEESPHNMTWFLSRVFPSMQMVRVPANVTVRVDHLVAPLERTFCPVGWKPEVAIHSREIQGWWVDGPSLKRFQNRAGKLTSKVDRGSRIFLERGKHIHSPLVEAQELRDYLQKLGFVPLNPTQGSLEEVIAALAKASEIVATQGSQLFNLVLCKPGLKVHVIRKNSFGFDWLGSLGHDVRSIIASPAVPSDPTLSPYELKQLPMHLNLGALNDSLTT